MTIDVKDMADDHNNESVDDVADSIKGGAKKISASVGKGGKNKPFHTQLPDSTNTLSSRDS